MNSETGGWSERAVEELGADVERIDEVGQQVVDVAHLFFLGHVEVVAGGDGRLGDARFTVRLLATVILDLCPPDHTCRKVTARTLAKCQQKPASLAHFRQEFQNMDSN